MSYPSVAALCEDRGIHNLYAVPADALHDLLWDAFHRDLPLGTDYLREVADEVKAGNQRVRRIEDPNSPLGKQITRLLGADVARQICQRKLGVAFGLYNCCVVIAALDVHGLNINAVEQIELQNGVLASADC